MDNKGNKIKSIFLMFCLLLLFRINAMAQRSIPDDNLAYPVLINLKQCGGVGSGFFLNTETAIFFVTARHVLFDVSKPTRPLFCKEAELLSYPKDPKDKGRNIIVLDLEVLFWTLDKNNLSSQ